MFGRKSFRIVGTTSANWQRRFATMSLAGLGQSAVVSTELFAYRDLMAPAAALEKQIAQYRAMTGEQRLLLALDLHAFSCEIARENIRRTHPDADPAEVEQ